MSILDRKFDTPEALHVFLQEAIAEEEQIKEAKQRRPLHEGDQLFRQTFILDGKAYWSSVVIRADGSVEFWIKRYEDSDFDSDGRVETTHKGFTLATILTPRTGE